MQDYMGKRELFLKSCYDENTYFLRLNQCLAWEERLSKNTAHQLEIDKIKNKMRKAIAKEEKRPKHEYFSRKLKISLLKRNLGLLKKEQERFYQDSLTCHYALDAARMHIEKNDKVHRELNQERLIYRPHIDV